MGYKAMSLCLELNRQTTKLFRLERSVHSAPPLPPGLSNVCFFFITRLREWP